MSDPTTDNKAADVVSDALQKLIEGVGVDAAEAGIIAEFPWLGVPVVKQILEWFLNKISSYFYVAAANAATSIVIDVQTNMESSTAIVAFQTLQMAIAGGDPNAIQKASQDLSSAYASLIHSDGWSPPKV